MEPKDLANLPPIFQVIAGFGLFFGTFMLAIGGWLWKQIKPKMLGGSSSLPPANSSEAVVLSAAIADSHSIAKLGGAVEKLVQHLEDSDEDYVRAAARLERRVGDVVTEVERMHDTLNRLAHNMKDRTIL